MLEQESIFNLMYDSIVDYMKSLNFNNFDDVYQYVGTWGLYKQIIDAFQMGMSLKGMATDLNVSTIYLTCLANIATLRSQYEIKTIMGSSNVSK